MNYISIINKYFRDNAAGRGMYLIHVTLVTQKALQIAQKLNINKKYFQFIEEASMLHDIGCCNVNFPEMGCYGKQSYICHMTEGYRILKDEGWPKHAQVALTHTGVGIYANEVREQDLPLEAKDYIAETLEEKIISYADLFFSKTPESLFAEKSTKQIKESLSKFGCRHVKTFDEWHGQFGI